MSDITHIFIILSAIGCQRISQKAPTKIYLPDREPTHACADDVGHQAEATFPVKMQTNIKSTLTSLLLKVKQQDPNKKSCSFFVFI